MATVGNEDSAPEPEASDTARSRSWPLLAIAVVVGLSWFAIVAGVQPLANLLLFGQDWWINNSLWRFVGGLLVAAVVIPLAWKAYSAKDSYAEIVGLRPPQGRQWVWATALLVATVVPMFFAPGGILAVIGKMGITAGIVPLLVALQAPVVEEILMRGDFVHIASRGGWSPVIVSIVGMLVFGMWHVLSFGPQGLFTGLVSVALMYVPRYLTGGIYVPFVIHWVMNSGTNGTLTALLVALIELVALVVWWRNRKSSRSVTNRRVLLTPQ